MKTAISHAGRVNVWRLQLQMEDSFEGFEEVVTAGDEAGARAAEDVSDGSERDGEDAQPKPSPR